MKMRIYGGRYCCSCVVADGVAGWAVGPTDPADLPQYRKLRALACRLQNAKRSRKGFRRAPTRAPSISLTYDARTIGIDRGQRVFGQAFLEFSNRMAGAGRAPRGQQLIKKHAALFQEDRAAIWRAGAGDRRVLGTGERLRRRHRQIRSARVRSRRLLTIAAAASASARNYSRRLKIIERGDLDARQYDRLMGRRTRPDAIFAVALFHLWRRFRRRRQSRSAAQRAGCVGHDRALHPENRLARWRAVVARSARAEPHGLESGEPRYFASACTVDAMGRDLARWLAASGKRAASLAAASDGEVGARVSRLSEFPRLHRME